MNTSQIHKPSAVDIDRGLRRGGGGGGSSGVETEWRDLVSDDLRRCGRRLIGARSYIPPSDPLPSVAAKLSSHRCLRAAPTRTSRRKRFVSVTGDDGDAAGSLCAPQVDSCLAPHCVCASNRSRFLLFVAVVFSARAAPRAASFSLDPYVATGNARSDRAAPEVAGVRGASSRRADATGMVDRRHCNRAVALSNCVGGVGIGR